MSTLANQAANQPRTDSRSGGGFSRGSSAGSGKIPYNSGRNGHIHRGGSRGRGGFKKTRPSSRVDKRSVSATATTTSADLGSFLDHPEQYGYSKMEHKKQEVPKYMLKEQVLFSCDSYRTNEWDANNQKTLLQKEAEHSGDPQSLFEEFQELRKEERKKMEQMNLVDVENAKKSLTDAIIFRGSCMDMCPTYERVERSFKNQVSKWEKDPATGRISRQYAVKTFMRPSGQAPSLPSDVRTPQILVRTLSYLIGNLLPKLPESQSFIWDRTRSIRQDFTFQNNYSGPEAIDCHEKICRIHILSSHVMAQANDPDYQQQQEIEQFNNSLQSLTHMYDDVRSRGGRCPNEAEFRAYELISKLKDTELDRNIQKLPANILGSSIVQKALMLRGLVIDGFGNFQMFIEFFRVIMDPNTPFLLSCLCEIHFNQVRHMAMATMAKAYHSKSKKMPEVTTLAEWLGFDSTEQLLTTCKFYDIPIIQDDKITRIEVTALRQAYKAYQKPPSSTKLNYKMMNSTYQDIVSSGIPNNDLKLKVEPRIEAPPPASVINDIFETSSVEPSPHPMLPPEIEKIEVLPEPPKVQPQPSVFAPVQQQQPVFTGPPKQPSPEPVKIVEPPKPAKKLVESPNFDSAARAVVNNLLQEVVTVSAKDITQKLVAQETQRRAQRRTQLREGTINGLADELFKAFLREQMYVSLIEVKAKLFRDSNLKRRTFKTIKAVAEKLAKKQQAKKSKLNEIQSFANQVRPTYTVPAGRVFREASVKPAVVKQTNCFADDTLSCVPELYPYVHDDLRMLVIVDTWLNKAADWISTKLELKDVREAGKLVKSNTIKTESGTLAISSIPERFRSRSVFKNVNIVLLKIEFPESNDLANTRSVVAKILEYLSKYNKEIPVTLVLLLVDFPTNVDLVAAAPTWLTVKSVHLSSRMSVLTVQNKFYQTMRDTLQNYKAVSTELPDAETTLMSKYTTIENSLVGLIKNDINTREKLEYIRSIAGKRKPEVNPDISLMTEQTPSTGQFEFSKSADTDTVKRRRKIGALLKLSESVLQK
ncbi:hypothetical protein OGAPHI_006030 [Ogataea philodendri]|uniref:Nuclear mRNA export factor n=1 Tax=Ogataea philodendri TaxID=1378263 RepID=A0A9P8T1M3_9ASCO|nr:uncharacterized protein OGAPHI_006030 [Ogataea philodendri]KAH3661851.1 hypothetical protein OGAPHI_006030 [Ogataea philodendri]